MHGTFLGAWQIERLNLETANPGYTTVWLRVTFSQGGTNRIRGEKENEVGYVFPISFLLPPPSSLCPWQKTHPSEMLGPTNSPNSTLELALGSSPCSFKAVVTLPALLTPAWVCHHPLLASLTLFIPL